MYTDDGNVWEVHVWQIMSIYNCFKCCHKYKLWNNTDHMMWQGNMLWHSVGVMILGGIFLMDIANYHVSIYAYFIMNPTCHCWWQNGVATCKYRGRVGLVPKILHYQVLQSQVEDTLRLWTHSYIHNYQPTF